MASDKNINLLREQMKMRGVQACIIPTSDPHLSEYTAKHFCFRRFLSPFTGSAGTLVITETESALWTDGRYYIQAERELKESETVLFRASEKKTEKLWEFLCRKLKEGSTVSICGRLRSKLYIDDLREKLEKGGLRLITDIDFSYIWKDRPPMVKSKIYALDEKYTGESAVSKLRRLRDGMREKGITHFIEAAADCIMWLLNIRGSDVLYTPVALCYMLISETDAFLYIDPKKTDFPLVKRLKEYGVTVLEYERIYDDIAALGEDARPGADFSKTNYSLVTEAKCPCKNVSDLVENMKCIKNEVETQNIKQAYIWENAALVKSFYTIYQRRGHITEFDAVKIIEENRRKNSEYMYPSFYTIAAYGANAAMMHYSPSEEKSALIGRDGMLLIDTGAQFPGGTTDTTRTLILGEISREQRENYTLVLKGHIALAASVFPEDTKSNALDAAARLPLWKKMLDYRCGTGHGVGCCLCVHEGPQRLSQSANTPLRAGMTITDEPGVYVENEYGIRIENHLQVTARGETQYAAFLGFDVLGYCPIGTQQLEKTLLSQEELKWLNDYNEKAQNLLAPYLTAEENIWLKNYSKRL